MFVVVVRRRYGVASAVDRDYAKVEHHRNFADFFINRYENPE